MYTHEVEMSSVCTVSSGNNFSQSRRHICMWYYIILLLLRNLICIQCLRTEKVLEGNNRCFWRAWLGRFYCNKNELQKGKKWPKPICVMNNWLLNLKAILKARSFSSLRSGNCCSKRVQTRKRRWCKWQLSKGEKLWADMCLDMITLSDYKW